jgi:hypothetical protein
MTHHKKVPRQDQTNNAPLLIVTGLVPLFFSVNLKNAKFKKGLWILRARSLVEFCAVGGDRVRQATKGKIYPKSRSWFELITLFLFENSRDWAEEVKKKNARTVRE